MNVVPSYPRYETDGLWWFATCGGDVNGNIAWFLALCCVEVFGSGAVVDV